MTDQSHDTKNKIMNVARVLFADQGFEGTSVREIAKVAEVNIASVNYHFSNKDNLFHEIIQASYLECSNAIRNYYDTENPKVEDVLVYIFRYFIQNSHDLFTFFKMMMSTQHNDKKMCQSQTGEDRFGPPGGEVIINAIQKELGSEISEKDQFWAVKCLFSHVIHQALLSSCYFKKQNHPYTTDADIEDSIRRLSRLVLSDLKNKN